MEIRKVRRDAEAFVRAVDREFYQNHAGLKEELNTSAIFVRYRHLFTPDAVAWIRDYRQGAEGEELRRARQLQTLLIVENLGNAVKHLTDREQTSESQRVLRVDGEEVPSRMATVRMANEADRARRRALYQTQNEALGEVNPLLAERMELLHRLARSLGYDHYPAPPGPGGAVRRPVVPEAPGGDPPEGLMADGAEVPGGRTGRGAGIRGPGPRPPHRIPGGGPHPRLGRRGPPGRQLYNSIMMRGRRESRGRGSFETRIWPGEVDLRPGRGG